MKTTLWILFLCTGFYMGLQSDILVRATPERYRIAQLEFAPQSRGQQILRTWNKIPFAGNTLLNVAEHNTSLNYLLLLLYTSLLLLYSYLQMQRERWLPLNELLRLNLIVCLFILLFGCMDNYLLLHNMRHVDDERFYLNPGWMALTTYLLSAWTLSVFTVSGLRSGFKKYRNRSIN